jgi:HPt (histidine-containing phosphotransfer) domain-containing protein
MIQAAIEFAEHDSAVPAYAVLDRAHLSRMTFNDHSLEREVLQLFERQAELLMTRMRNSGLAAIATLAHTLKGSAVGIGAARVAQAAVAVEQTASSAPDECHDAIDQLAHAVDEVRAEIVAMQCQR